MVLDPALSEAVERLLRDNPVLRVVATVRSASQQAALHLEKPDLALPAGRSKHETGHAVDVAGPIVEDSALWASTLRPYGLGYLRGATKIEPWHLELVGPKYITK